MINITKILNSLNIEEQIKYLVGIHYTYEELQKYFLKYKEEYKLVDLPLNYIFKYFKNKTNTKSKIDGSYVFLGLDLSLNKKYVIFTRLYKPKEKDWGKHQIRVALSKFKHNEYEITNKSTYNEH